MKVLSYIHEIWHTAARAFWNTTPKISSLSSVWKPVWKKVLSCGQKNAFCGLYRIVLIAKSFPRKPFPQVSNHFIVLGSQACRIHGVVKQFEAAFANGCHGNFWLVNRCVALIEHNYAPVMLLPSKLPSLSQNCQCSSVKNPHFSSNVHDSRASVSHHKVIDLGVISRMHW